MSIDLNKVTLQELKGLGYDQFIVAEQTRANIVAINAEIQRRLLNPNTEVLADAVRVASAENEKAEEKK